MKWNSTGFKWFSSGMTLLLETNIWMEFPWVSTWKKELAKGMLANLSSGNQVEKRTFKWISSGIIVYGFFFKWKFSSGLLHKFPLENSTWKSSKFTFSSGFQVEFIWNSDGIQVAKCCGMYLNLIQYSINIW